MAGESSMRVVPIGRAVWLRDDERDGVYLAALVVTPEWACITAGSWTRDPGGGVRDRMWFCEFTATDDTGASYMMGYNGAGTPQIQAGPFELAPQPPFFCAHALAQRLCFIPSLSRAGVHHTTPRSGSKLYHARLCGALRAVIIRRAAYAKSITRRGGNAKA